MGTHSLTLPQLSPHPTPARAPAAHPGAVLLRQWGKLWPDYSFPIRFLLDLESGMGLQPMNTDEEETYLHTVHGITNNWTWLSDWTTTHPTMEKSHGNRTNRDQNVPTIMTLEQKDWRKLRSLSMVGNTRIDGVFLVCFCFIFIFQLYRTACGILVPGQGLNPSSLHWKCRVLTTGQPGKSWELFFFCTTFYVKRHLRRHREQTWEHSAFCFD